MPAFERHLRAGIMVHAVVVFPIVVGLFTEVWSRQIGLLAAVGALPATMGGSIAPDVDHPSSLSYRLAYRWLPIVAAGTVALLLIHVMPPPESTQTGVTATSSVFAAGVLTGVLPIAVGYAVRTLIPILRPPHRGVVHTVPAGVVFAVATGGYAAVVTQIWGGWSPVVAGCGWGLASFIGFVTHLAQDGLLDLTYRRG